MTIDPKATCLLIETFQLASDGNIGSEPLLPDVELNFPGETEVDGQKYSFQTTGLSAIGICCDTVIDKSLTKAPNYHKCALCSIRYFDDMGKELTGDSRMGYSEKYGDFFYLKPEADGTALIKLIGLPVSCRRVDIQFCRFRPPLPARFKRPPQFLFYAKSNLLSEFISGKSVDLSQRASRAIAEIEFRGTESCPGDLSLKFAVSLYREGASIGNFYYAAKDFRSGFPKK